MHTQGSILTFYALGAEFITRIIGCYIEFVIYLLALCKNDSRLHTSIQQTISI